jgi:lipopolysaccharide/colanic/teichoic acid biosynthesis glycosyltransferase
VLKRLFDIILSLFCLLVLAPVLTIVGALVTVKLGRPIFYTQIRPGFHEKPFRMIKFRTMTNERDENGNLLPNEDRMTRFGFFLRSYSLDELPELFNVLKGDISLVGPRPLLKDYLTHFSEEQRKRHDVKPGITGWAQVNGRNAINWDEKLALDLWYVENRSLWLDIKILWRTFFKVLKREGITYKNHVAMPRFDEIKQKNKEYESDAKESSIK